MTEAEAVAQEQIRAAANELVKIRLVLQGIHSSLPAPARAEELRDEDEPRDASTVLRSTIECVLRDMIEPAIRNLLSAAAYRPEGEGH